MNPWTRGRGKGDYAEWFPELDLHVASRWECADEETLRGFTPHRLASVPTRPVLVRTGTPEARVAS
jgi:hypothetical protein